MTVFGMTFEPTFIHRMQGHEPTGQQADFFDDLCSKLSLNPVEVLEAVCDEIGAKETDKAVMSIGISLMKDDSPYRNRLVARVLRQGELF